jgi:NAD(P)-dependent dehydrogenase (short-subunit alcohol dehydrogenase family)
MDQKVLITGTSTGFGRLTAETLLQAGHTVVASMREIRGRNQGHAEALRDKGAKIVEIDVADEESVEKGTQEALNQAGGLDVLVNNAGIGVLGLQETFSVEDWKKVFEINVFGVQRMDRAILPHFREKKSGLLVHISSLLGRMVLPFYGPYNATKYALEALADNYRVELSGFGIESVLIEPGAYGTDFAGNLIKPSDKARLDSYGDYAKVPEQQLEGFGKLLEGENAPNPQVVADAVKKIIETPKGKKPFRTVLDKLGMGNPIESYNQNSDELTKGVYTAFGMDEMLSVK